MVVGRLAPSPTGAQHIGNARTYLLAWLAVRSRGGRLLLRVEDLDSPRVKPGADQEALADLRWLGLDWDEGPDVGGPAGPYQQTARLNRYQVALAALQAAERVYPCTCSRSDVQVAASAPHAGQEGPVYPRTCAVRRSADARSSVSQALSWRFRTTDREYEFQDAVAGPQRCCPSASLGDFVVARSDGSIAYQLAVVVDDHDMGVTEVVRGDDLLPSTFRQLELYDFFGWQPPHFAHVPLVVGPDGRRLAKRHGDTRLATLRALRIPAEKLVGLLAWSCGWLKYPEPLRPVDLLACFDWTTLPAAPWVFSDYHWSWLRGNCSWDPSEGSKPSR